MKNFVLLSLFLSACCYEADYPSNEVAEELSGTQEAATIVSSEFSKAFQTIVHDTTKLNITWFSGASLHYDCRDNNGNLYGATLPGIDEIHLLDYDGTITGSAFTHEMIHWLLEQEHGDLDVEHMKQEWLVETFINDRLKTEGF